MSYVCFFFVKGSVDHRDLHLLTHSFPTRRGSDLTMSATVVRSKLWEPPKRVRRDELVKISDRLLGEPDIPWSRDEDIARIHSNGMDWDIGRSEEHTSELQSLMRISYAVFCLKKKIKRVYNT